MTLSRFFFWILFLVIVLFSTSLKLNQIQKQSSVFDEPFHLYRAIAFAQTKNFQSQDVHPTFFPWLLSKTIPLLGQFEPLNKFIQDKENFKNPYQYRIDKFSHLPENESIIRGRKFFQIFWVLFVLFTLLIAKELSFSNQNLLLLLALISLEPSFIGMWTVLNSDTLLLCFLAMGTFFLIRNGKLSKTISFLFFSIAWATKLTTVLWGVPLYFILKEKKIETKFLIIWFLPILVGIIFSQYTGGWESQSKMLLDPTFRLSYLNGVFFQKTPWYYFLQAFLCKISLSSILLLAISLQKKRNYLFHYSLFFLLIASSFILPGIGIRLVFPLLFFAFLFLSRIEINIRMWAFILLLLSTETFWNQEALLSYQNPLAGKEKRLLDSNTDWGQGLKSFSHWWMKNHLKDPLALSLFGGEYPETYGVKDYYSLPSFPEPHHPDKPIDKNTYRGFVAVSTNFLKGYLLYHSSLIELNQLTPVACFHEALCVFDVRGDRKS